MIYNSSRKLLLTLNFSGQKQLIAFWLFSNVSNIVLPVTCVVTLTTSLYMLPEKPGLSMGYSTVIGQPPTVGHRCFLCDFWLHSHKLVSFPPHKTCVGTASTVYYYLSCFQFPWLLFLEPSMYLNPRMQNLPKPPLLPSLSNTNFLRHLPSKPTFHHLINSQCTHMYAHSLHPLSPHIQSTTHLHAYSIYSRTSE